MRANCHILQSFKGMTIELSFPLKHIYKHRHKVFSVTITLKRTHNENTQKRCFDNLNTYSFLNGFAIDNLLHLY